MLARALHILINCVRNQQITNGIRFTEPRHGINSNKYTKLQLVDLQDVMSQNRTELPVKSTTLTVVGRLIHDCRREIQHVHSQKCRENSFDNPMYNNYYQRYMDIFKSLKQQNIDIQSLRYDFLIEMLEWGLDGRGQVSSVES